MTDVAVQHLQVLDADAIREGLEAVLDDRLDRLDGADSVVLLPDAHYPYHRSTGLVTNPDVVEELAALVDAPTAIGVPDGVHLDADRTSRYLGLAGVADRTDSELVDLAGARDVERQVRFVDSAVTLAVPEPLLESPVVVVPTARRDQRFGVAAGMVTLAHAVTPTPTRAELLAAARVCWPSVSVLDATYTYPGEPRRTGLLAASDDVVALSRRAAETVGVDPADVSHLEARRTPPSPGSVLPFGRSREPQAGEDGLMEAGYRAYARMTGDLLPPQMLPRGEEE